MSGTLIAIIILAAIIGGYLIDYQKNKLKWQSQNKQSDEQLDDIHKELALITKRVENLEAIIADESFGSVAASTGNAADIELNDEVPIKKENEKRVSEQAKKVKGD